MLRMLTVPTLAVLLLPLFLHADDPPKNDKDLEGEWVVTSVVFDGKEQPLPRDGKQLMTFRGDALTITLKDVVRRYAVSADVSKTPKTLDLTDKDGTDKGGTLPGLYEVKGDELRLCNSKPGKDRPTELSSKEGKEWTLLTLKRVKK